MPYGMVYGPCDLPTGLWPLRRGGCRAGRTARSSAWDPTAIKSEGLEQRGRGVERGETYLTLCTAVKIFVRASRLTLNISYVARSTTSTEDELYL